MMKYLLILAYSFNLFAYIAIPASTKQLLVVSADGFENNQALLKTFERLNNKWTEVFKPIHVNLGRNGLGWGEGIIRFKHQQNEPIKMEGDGRSPAGLFRLATFFGYEQHRFDFPYLQVDENTLCIDDSDSPYYNMIIQAKEKSPFNSYEFMKREDILYRRGITVMHNEKNVKKHGSCIFLHIQKAEGSPTSGCTSMSEEQLIKIMTWLKKEQNPLLLQLPEAYLQKGFK